MLEGENWAGGASLARRAGGGLDREGFVLMSLQIYENKLELGGGAGARGL